MIKGTWQIRVEPDYVWNMPDAGPASEAAVLELLRDVAILTTNVWNMPDAGPASEAAVLELLRDVAILTTNGQRTTVVYNPTYEELQKRGLT